MSPLKRARRENVDTPFSACLPHNCQFPSELRDFVSYDKQRSDTPESYLNSNESDAMEVLVSKCNCITSLFSVREIYYF
jgi:hypothetical protein